MVGQLQAGEIDFVCTKPKGDRIYVQASYIIADDKTYEREFGNLCAICTFSGREYKYDPAQRVDTVIYLDEKEFMTSKSSKWQRGRRIVSYLTEVFRATQIQ